MQYLLNTALYMLEPSEVKLFNFAVIFLIATAIYSTYVFLPTQLTRIIEWWTHAANTSVIHSAEEF
jgi:hypothetical protein